MKCLDAKYYADVSTSAQTFHSDVMLVNSSQPTWYLVLLKYYVVTLISMELDNCLKHCKNTFIKKISFFILKLITLLIPTTNYKPHPMT